MSIFFTFFLTLFVASSVWAIEIDGIHYRYDSQTNTCSVISGNYSGDVVIPTTISGKYNFTKHTIVMGGGSRSMNGSFYTFDNGVQTATQLEYDATNVVLCSQTFSNHFRFISGTIVENETVKTQSSETKFVMIHDATEEEFEKVDWSSGTTTIDISSSLLSERTVAFKNEKCEGFFEIVGYEFLKEDLTINIWIYGNDVSIKDVTVTTIEEGAFSRCSNLKSISIPSSVIYIGEKAFYGCTELTKVTCLATTPPYAWSNAFENYNSYLYVMCESKEKYDLDAVWGNFKYIECIGSETIALLKDEVVVEPEKDKAVFSMPRNENANSYTLTIKNNGVTFCTLTFNAQGQLANIDFSTTKSYELKADVSAFKFSVTGLSAATDYKYSFKALASNKTVLKEYSGSFTTKNEDGTGGSSSGGGAGTLAVDNVSANNAITISNNQILVNGEAPAFVVTVAGQKITNANLKSGVYFVVVDGEMVKVMK